MKGRRHASGLQPDVEGKLGISEERLQRGRQVLNEQEEFNEEENRVSDLLTRGLSREFPNPQRVGCPDSAVLRGIAFRRLRLSEVDRGWSTSAPAARAIRNSPSCEGSHEPTASHAGLDCRSRGSNFRGRWMAVGADSSSVQPRETAVLDLRELSVARGQDPTQTGQRPLEIHRSAKHLILDLPIGSKEGPTKSAC